MGSLLRAVLVDCLAHALDIPVFFFLFLFLSSFQDSSIHLHSAWNSRWTSSRQTSSSPSPFLRKRTKQLSVNGVYVQLPEKSNPRKKKYKPKKIRNKRVPNKNAIYWWYAIRIGKKISDLNGTETYIFFPSLGKRTERTSVNELYALKLLKKWSSRKKITK